MSTELKAMSYAEISRKADFGSRNYARELANGSRNLSTKSLQKLIRGLGLKGDAAKFLERLAHRDDPTLSAGEFDEAENLKQLNRHRERLTHRKNLRRLESDTTIFQIKDWPVVYAALGTLAIGATTDEIMIRTGFSVKKCERILEEMQSRSIVVREDARFRALNGHMIFSEQTVPGAFQAYFQNGLKRVHTASEAQFSSDNQLFYASSFSVPGSKLPELKRKLREILLEFTESSEEPHGETVASLVCGFVDIER